jgi:hypothetical protein
MKRPLLFAATVAAMLLFPALATAKGPSVATISGPGLTNALRVEGYGPGGEGGTDSLLGVLVTEGGFFAQAFGATPSATVSRPAVALGPRYEVTYTVPGGPNGDSTLRQDLYPYAVKVPVTYMAPSQKFWDTQSTPGGWYRGGSTLKRALLQAGMPTVPPTTRQARNVSGLGQAHKLGIAVGAGAGIALSAGALALLYRHRRSPSS